MSVILWTVLLAICSSAASAQGSTAWQAFYPYHKGDVRQYRSIFTGEITHTQYTDSVVVDSASKAQFIFGRNFSGASWSTEYKIDSSGNLYNMDYQSSYVRYKLNADSGDSWIGGYFSDTTRPVLVSVQYTYTASIFGVESKVKVYQFDAMNSPDHWLTMGHDHLAEGFGLVLEQVEPSNVYQLWGAVIGGVRYGVIDALGDASTAGQPPTAFALGQNYPNPFNPSTTIGYALPRRSHVSLQIFNTLGERVAELLYGDVPAGYHDVQFNAGALPSGVYFYRLAAGDFVQTKRLVLVR